jgi:hypothetical protein
MLGGGAANENSCQEHVVKAVVAAGLYPNVVSVTNSHGRSARPPRLSVRGIGRVELHPKSALAVAHAFPHPYLVYHTMVRSSACFVHDATCVPIMALILFGGKLSFSEVVEEDELVAMTLDGWLTLHVAAQSAACVKALTERMQHCLQAKFSNPSLDVCVPSINSPPQLTLLSLTTGMATRALQPSPGRRCIYFAAVSQQPASLQPKKMRLILLRFKVTAPLIYWLKMSSQYTLQCLTEHMKLVAAAAAMLAACTRKQATVVVNCSCVGLLISPS